MTRDDEVRQLTAEIWQLILPRRNPEIATAALVAALASAVNQCWPAEDRGVVVDHYARQIHDQLSSESPTFN